MKPWQEMTGLTGIMERLLPALMSLLVLAVALGISWQVWKGVQDAAAQERQARFDTRVQEVASRIEHQTANYMLVLRGARGWLLTSTHAERGQFAEYIDALHLQANFPGIQSIEYSVSVPAAEYASIGIASDQPQDGITRKQNARDERTCRAAIAQVHDPDKGFVTGKLALAGSMAGFLMCAPIYVGAADTTGLHGTDMAGWVIMRFGMEGLLFGVLGNLYRDNAIAIHDGEEATAQNLMYQSGSPARSGSEIAAVRHIETAGHYWTLKIAGGNTDTADGNGAAQLVLYAGIGISLLLSALAWILLRDRAKAVRLATDMGGELIERRRTEKDLRLAATVYDTMDEAVTVTDADNRFVSVNPAFTAITGYGWNEVIGRTPKILSSGLHAPEFYREMWASLNSTGAWQGEISNRRKNGDVYVEWLSIKRVVDEERNSVCHIAVFSDISKRKAAEMQLFESRETLHSVIETAMDAVVLTNAFGVITNWNVRAEEIFGWSSEQACGRDLQDMIAPFKYLDGSVSSLRDFMLLKNGTSGHRVIETTATRSDGSEFPVELTIALVRMKGKRAFSCFIHDVSARQKRDVALQAANANAEAASRAKSEFLANMSHEIRTPMNSILGMAYLALKTELNPKQRDYLEKIHYSGQHLLGIINDILDFSKIEAGKLKVEQVDLNLHKVIENITSMLGGKAAEKGLGLEFRIDRDVPVHLRGDPLRLGQVLINYVSNAIKFTDAGVVTIHARRIEETGDGILLGFDVKDTGIGISKEEMGRLFQLFQQADTSITRKFGGTGLGLAISKQLAELMGGKVGVESELGKGSTFWFTALLEKVQLASSGEYSMDKPQECDAQQALRGARILLVEDNHFNQLVATDLLEEAGVAVTIANNGKEALTALQQRRFDCVLMDMQMPEMDGLEATRRIRTDAATAEMPVIAMTANTRTEDRDSCIAAGMNDLITKPILPEAFYATLASYLTKREYRATVPAQQGETQTGREVIDLAVLARMVGNDQEKIRKYANKFVASAREGLGKSEDAIREADMKALAALGHRIKSSARTVGAFGFAGLCQALEQPELSMDRAKVIVSEMTGLLALIGEEIEGVCYE